MSARRFAVLGGVGAVTSVSTIGVIVGVGTAGWLIGLLCSVLLSGTLALSLDSRAWSHRPGPADLVTLARAVIACTLAALTTEALLHHLVTPWFVPLTVVALLLDAVDGWVARRTGTSSAFGSRFDGEVDAFLILVLSVQVAPTFGAWTVTAGLMRYGFMAAGCVLPWMRERLPYRHWRKVATAAQGIVLAVAAAAVLPRWAGSVGLALGLALLCESFGRDVAWLWNERATRLRSDSAAAVTTTAVTSAAVTTTARPEPQTEAV